MVMTFIDFFAGVGGFRRGMELAGHKCVGFCEIDKYAVASYVSMHLLTEEQRAYLATLPLKERQKEILKDEYKNGEWYADDIRSVDFRNMPRADVWCFGFPCQDISIAGRVLGFNGSRSSLFFAVTDIIDHLREEDRPKFLFIENVRNLLSVNQGFDFAKLLVELDKLGYDAEWQVLNSKDFGVPQNRERCFIIGYPRAWGGDRPKIFPVEATTVKGSVPIMRVAHANNFRRYHQTYDPAGTIECMDTMQGGGREPCVINIIGSLDPSRHSQMDIMHEDGLMTTLDTMHEPKKVAVNVVGGIGEKKSNSGTQFFQQDRVYDGSEIATSLSGQLPGGANKYTVDPTDGVDTIYYPKGDCQIAIRKLTPKECFRLQGWTDDYFAKAEFVNSDTQLYKQAGNGVTVPVIEAIARRIGDANEMEMLHL